VNLIFSLIFKNQHFVFTRLLIPLLVLSSCSDEAETDAAQEAALTGERIECALAGSTKFTQTCSTQRVAGENGTILMIKHKDGGFRRFNILTDGRGLEAADGFDPTTITIIDENYILLVSGGDQYRLKARSQNNASTRSEALPNASDSSIIEGNSLQDEDNNQGINQNNEQNGSQELSDRDVGPIGTPGAPYPIPR